jgi:hypothetical protein
MLLDRKGCVLWNRAAISMRAGAEGNHLHPRNGTQRISSQASSRKHRVGRLSDGTNPHFSRLIRISEMGMKPLITAGLVFGSAGVPPVGSRSVKTRKITGETPAL